MEELLLAAATNSPLTAVVDPITLIGRYNPYRKGPIHSLLIQAYGDMPIIAFCEDGTVAVEQSAGHLQEYEMGHDPLESIEVDGIETRLYRVGVIPNNFVPANALWPNEALRSGKCRHTGCNYSDVSHDNQVFFAVGVEMGFFTAHTSDIDKALDYFKYMETLSLKELRQRYGKVSLRYGDLEQEDQLPTLRVRLGGRAVQQQKPSQTKSSDWRTGLTDTYTV